MDTWYIIKGSMTGDITIIDDFSTKDDALDAYHSEYKPELLESTGYNYAVKRHSEISEDVLAEYEGV